MDLAVKIFQMAFYFIASTVAVLTFIKAKNGLLNSVNTEYQKKVMERLSSVSEQLWEEFDFSSENHWSKNDSLKETLERIHEYALKNKHEILTGKKGFAGVPLPKKQMEIMALKEKLKSDPFIPHEIRDKLLKILENRVSSMFEAYHSVIGDYQNDLVKGKHWDTFDENSSWISNKIVNIMSNNGAGISDLESGAHEVRLEIQKFYDGFNPLKN
jgi:hypothetical protein